MSKPKIIIILGPTAVGKTSLAIDLARSIGGEIISIDSRLFYRGMDIGTAKPTIDEQNQVKHHLINVSLPDEIWSVAKYKDELLGIVRDLDNRGVVPILVGGTGQYIRAITSGWSIPKFESNIELRKELESWANEIGVEKFHEKLMILDSEAAENIDYRNLRRNIRAMEVILSTGKKFSAQRIKEDIPYRILQIGLIRPRKILFDRIDQRVEEIIKAGFKDEVQKLLDDGFNPDLPSMSAIGYPQMVSVISGEITVEEAIISIKSQTHKFVRRQRNWFKPDNPEIKWFDLEKPQIINIVKAINEFLEDGE